MKTEIPTEWLVQLIKQSEKVEKVLEDVRNGLDQKTQQPAVLKLIEISSLVGFIQSAKYLIK